MKNKEKNDFFAFFQEQTKSSEKLYCNYLGITRKEYPKWSGWKIIVEYKERGFDIKDINDPVLEKLVKNFYYLKWIEENNN